MSKKKKREEQEENKESRIEYCFISGCKNMKMDESDVCMDHYQEVCDTLWEFELKWREKYEKQKEILKR